MKKSFFSIIFLFCFCINCLGCVIPSKNISYTLSLDEVNDIIKDDSLFAKTYSIVETYRKYESESNECMVDYCSLHEFVKTIYSDKFNIDSFSYWSYSYQIYGEKLDSLLFLYKVWGGDIKRIDGLDDKFVNDTKFHQLVFNCKLYQNYLKMNARTLLIIKAICPNYISFYSYIHKILNINFPNETKVFEKYCIINFLKKEKLFSETDKNKYVIFDAIKKSYDIDDFEGIVIYMEIFGKKE